MTIKMTQEEYEKKYGVAPIVSQPTQQTPQQGGTLQNVKDIGIGFAKRAGETVKGIQDFGQRALAGIDPTQTYEQVKSSTGINALENADFSATNNYQKAGKVVEFAAEVLAPMGARKVAIKGGQLVSKGIKPVLNTAGKVLKGAGESAYGVTVTPAESTAQQLLKYDAKQPNFIGRVKNFFKGTAEGVKPITEANTAARKGLVGTEYQLGVQAKKVATELWDNVVGPKLDAVKGQVNMKDFFDQVEKTIVKETKELSRRKALKEALGALRENYQKVGKVSLKKLQEYKEGFAKFLPDSSYKGKPIGAALKEVQDISAKKAREIIYKFVGEDGKQAYIDYGNLQSIIEAGTKSITGDAAKRSLGRNVWEFVMDKAVTPVATMGGKVLYKTGEGLEFLGKKGAKTVMEALD